MVGGAAVLCQWWAGLLPCANGGWGCCPVPMVGVAAVLCQWWAGLLSCANGGQGCCPVPMVGGASLNTSADLNEHWRTCQFF